MQPDRWTKEAANSWFTRQGKLIGSNYVPANAINQLEMWQADTFDSQRIDTELRWAENLGMTTMRVFLHDLLWEQDSEGFKQRIDQFLTICESHKIRPMFVLFDSVWDPLPQTGPQREPTPGVHNSGWVQGPGSEALKGFDTHSARLQSYVQGVIGAFAQDRRILAWDIWNEPDNTNGINPLYNREEPANKSQVMHDVLPQVFQWAREAAPSQPLTTGIWIGEWAEEEKMEPLHRLQIALSDIVSFHNYDPPAEFGRRVRILQRYERPLMCTEYMARGQNNTFENILPLMEKFNVAAFNWGFVAGRSQTNLPWDSWKEPYVGSRQPDPWFHDIFHEDGSPYRKNELGVIKNFRPKGP